MTRDELIGILTEIVHATRARSVEARTADGLKAAEMLAKMCGWNEPEKVNVQSVEVKVDAALIAQLRGGYAELSNATACAKEKACLVASVDHAPTGYHREFLQWGYISKATPPPGPSHAPTS
jgi:hypothetical protein